MVLSLLALAAVSQSQSVPEMRLMRYPSVHGNEVVFTYAADLWTATLDGGYARRLTSHPGVERKAYYSPDGSQIAFTAQYDGNQDIYVMPADGGEPKRLTYETGTNLCEGWTPDGKIAYISAYGSFNARQYRLWEIDPKGGLPQPTPLLEASDVSFSPDGAKVAYTREPSDRFNWRRYRGGSQGVVSIYDLKTNSYRELPHGRENQWNPMWVGDSIYFASDKNEQTVNLYRYDINSGDTVQLTHYTDADIHWPESDGKTVVFERDGYLYRYDIKTKDAERIYPEVRSDLLATRPQLRHLGGAISSFALSPSGVRVVAEARGDIFSIPVRAGETRDMTPNSSGSRARFPDWSPDGKTIAYVSDRTGEYEIYTQPQMGGTPEQMTDVKGFTITGLGWSPDSKHIAYTTTDLTLNLLDTETKKSVTVYTGQYGSPSNFDFSPDGKWIAYIGVGKNLFGAAYLYNVDTNTSTKITSGFYNDTQVSFDLSGKYLYLLSDRTFNPTQAPFEDNLFLGPTQRVYVMTLAKDTKNPLQAEDDEETGTPSAPPAGAHAGPPPAGAGAAKPPAAPAGPPPTKIDLDGLGDRVIPLPMPAGNYGTVIGMDTAVAYISNGALVRFDLHARQGSPIFMPVAGPIAFNPTRTKLAYFVGGTLGVADIHPGPPITPGEGKVDTSAVEAVIDPRAEWRQIFWEGWRYERDNFYDKSYVGLDWNEIGQHYAEYLPYVAHRDDLNYILGLMIGEFGTSHAYVLGGDYGAPVPTIPIGQLGADYELDNGKVKVKRVLRGESFVENREGPLAAPGVNVHDGDYILAIDGQPVDATHTPDSYLVDKAGKEVQITVNSAPTMEGSHNVMVKPIADESELRYNQWVVDERNYVSKKSGGRIGYMHVPDTSEAGMSGFLEGYYSQSDKDAMIVDERWNGGGHIPTFFTEKLARTYRAFLKARHGNDIGFPVQTVQGPKAMLINGYAGSGGDLFPWLFRQAKLGPLIGERTWGGLVGINGSAPLIDGGLLTSPGFGLFDQTTGKWIAENNGIEPDIPVDARPDLVAKGEDPQLDAAIDYLMKELAKGPPVFKEPTYPRIQMPPKPEVNGGG